MRTPNRRSKRRSGSRRAAKLCTYVIGVGHFSHGIAGSFDVFALASAGEIGWGEALWRFTVPSLLGNIIGGVALVASLNHAQVVARKE